VILPRLCPRFQSHAGSIEATPYLEEDKWNNWSFNPTLVRLRLSLEHVFIAMIALFQSHAGSIEAGACCRLGNTEFPSFNPTLVRLRPG